MQTVEEHPLSGTVALVTGGSREVASLVAYLATRDAAFITGASLTIDGEFIA